MRFWTDPDGDFAMTLANSRVYLRTTATQGIMTGFRLYMPSCESAEDCPLALVPAAELGTPGLSVCCLMALTGMHWSSWTFSEATGTGAFVIATTSSSSIPVRVTLSQPVQACGRNYWSRAELTNLADNTVPADYQKFFDARWPLLTTHHAHRELHVPQRSAQQATTRSGMASKYRRQTSYDARQASPWLDGGCHSCYGIDSCFSSIQAQGRRCRSSGGPAVAGTPAPGTEPAAAKETVRLLLSPRGRSALTPELNAVLPAGNLFPAGTTFTQVRGTWHQADAYANVTGLIREPGQVPRKAEIGFVHRHGHWLVTFEVFI